MKQLLMDSTMSLSPSQHRNLVASQTGIAKKVFECVPIQEPWHISAIVTEVARSSSSRPDTHIVSGCLRTLCDVGLIREPTNGCFQRIAVKEEKMPTTPATKTPVVSEQDLLSRLGQMAPDASQRGP